MINYPYLPRDKEIKFVSLQNEYLREAKKLAESSTCIRIKTGAVIVKDGRIIGRGSNTGRKKVEVCPRQEEVTGRNYRFCQIFCGQRGHAEVVAINDALEKKEDTKAADLYLWGHWWCCRDCWDKMIEAGIRDVYLVQDAFFLFNKDINLKPKKAYIAGALTNLAEQSQKKFYQDIAKLCKDLKIEPYLPHLFTDPIKNTEFTPRDVYERNYQEIQQADLLIAEVSQPSLSVGVELEIAHQNKTNVILLAREDSKISRMAQGNPAVVEIILYKETDSGLRQLKRLLEVWLMR